MRPEGHILRPPNLCLCSTRDREGRPLLGYSLTGSTHRIVEMAEEAGLPSRLPVPSRPAPAPYKATGLSQTPPSNLGEGSGGSGAAGPTGAALSWVGQRHLPHSSPPAGSLHARSVQRELTSRCLFHPCRSVWLPICSGFPLPFHPFSVCCVSVSCFCMLLLRFLH